MFGHVMEKCCNLNTNMKPAMKILITIHIKPMRRNGILKHTWENLSLQETCLCHKQVVGMVPEVVNILVNIFLPDNAWEFPNVDSASFFNRLNMASEPFYDNCVERLSKFLLAADVMHIKTNHNLAETCVDDVSHLIHKILPKGNVASQSYYETEKLMCTLSMPYHRIDICQNNCMIYWGDPDENLIVCKFCEHLRYKPQKTSRKDSSTRKRIPYKRMFYLPLADRLKRLYLSERIATHMRWHAEHTSQDGKMEHPSDDKACKHFQELYPEFASNSRNIYLGLCTDGFNPFGSSGGNYSLWPIILTPYNLPPDMCMKREYLYLSILVPGRNHPKRSLDIFLRPLIEEL
ncbi:PREDICTED: uncharacterized protein LOC104771968 [Camelina sativa]|uniref:Uncharacterized protein LOC104771968 n=1 Tax=Camelina sativa TaxID=90675 RepID=A0ABM0Y3L0_CAMSA|nr:PREDICTED: uncharacterized protein LOC104771968 [Camelina sativa]XP_010494906.1 PREDICTED: uncharacterized protein LOC104771968 [Camelina sativa]XP_010494907.1 PREDICTED: uncharacterized protein LOC104771968 [Camelina sativa]